MVQSRFNDLQFCWLGSCVVGIKAITDLLSFRFQSVFPPTKVYHNWYHQLNGGGGGVKGVGGQPATTREIFILR